MLFGASRLFEESAALLSALLGFPVSATSVQRTTECTGERLDDDPYRLPEGFRSPPGRSLSTYLQ